MTLVHFSSATDLWSTPPDFFSALDRVFHFTLDACATAENAKCARFYTREQDGLAQPWTGNVWCNPPYGRTIGKWMRKAWESAQNGATVVCLVPARTCTRWWHDYATKGDVLFLRGRLKFGDAESSAPFPSALVVFSRDSYFAKRHLKQCAECDGIFLAERSDAELCGGACRMRRYRRAA
jgi:phage N-6-adenine-methyltransferase